MVSPTKQPPVSAGAQTVLAIGSAFVIMVLLSFAKSAVIDDVNGEVIRLEMSVQNTARAELWMAVSRDKTPGLFEIRNDAAQATTIFLPSYAKLREVRGMALEAVQRTGSGGLPRGWTLPPRVTFSFTLPNSPESFTVKAQAKEPVLMRMRSIFLETAKVEDESTLLQTGEIALW